MTQLDHMLDRLAREVSAANCVIWIMTDGEGHYRADVYDPQQRCVVREAGADNTGDALGELSRELRRNPLPGGGT